MPSTDHYHIASMRTNWCGACVGCRPPTSCRMTGTLSPPIGRRPRRRLIKAGAPADFGFHVWRHTVATFLETAGHPEFRQWCDRRLFARQPDRSEACPVVRMGGPRRRTCTAAWCGCVTLNLVKRELPVADSFSLSRRAQASVAPRKLLSGSATGRIPFSRTRVATCATKAGLRPRLYVWGDSP
jgi:hypothetical protein